MTYRDALQEGTKQLEAAGSDTPYLDALVVLTEATGDSKERLFARFTEPVPEDSYLCYRRLIGRRSEGIPVAYLTNRKEFFGREFYVDERVLIPRADTERLVEEALDTVRSSPTLRRVHDLGTGSGCIALTLKAERPDLVVSASDSSPGACEVFSINASRLGLQVPVTETSLFEGIRGLFDMIVSNPPYLTDAEADAMAESGWPEPQSSLRAGTQGLDCIAQIIGESVHYLVDSGVLLLEAAPAQMSAIRAMMSARGFTKLSVVCDLAGRERVVSGVKYG